MRFSRAVRAVGNEGRVLTSPRAVATLCTSHAGVIMKAPKFAVLALIGTLSLVQDLLSAQEPQHHHDADEKLGTVSFLTSCAPAVQSQFDGGVALLYSFEYELADAQFVEVAKKDPRC